MRECAFVFPTNESARRGAVRADIQPAGSEFGAHVAWKPPPLADKRAPRALCASRSPCGWRGPYPPRPRFARCGQVAGLKGLAIPNLPGPPERGFGPSSEWPTIRSEWVRRFPQRRVWTGSLAVGGKGCCRREQPDHRSRALLPTWALALFCCVVVPVADAIVSKGPGLNTCARA